MTLEKIFIPFSDMEKADSFLKVQVKYQVLCTYNGVFRVCEGVYLDRQDWENKYRQSSLVFHSIIEGSRGVH